MNNRIVIDRNNQSNLIDRIYNQLSVNRGKKCACVFVKKLNKIKVQTFILILYIFQPNFRTKKSAR